MATERSRIDEEREAKEQRERAALADREARERRRTEEEALRAAAERDQLLEEDRRRREEQARLDGIKSAELVRVRDEAARKVALETALLSREHELRLASIRQMASGRTMRAALVATTFTTLAAFGALAWLELGVHPERTARLEAELTRVTQAERVRADRAEGMLKTSEATRGELEGRLRVLEATPPPASTSVVPSRPSLHVPPRVPHPPARPPVCKGDPHDPLNGCLSP